MSNEYGLPTSWLLERLRTAGITLRLVDGDIEMICAGGGQLDQSLVDHVRKQRVDLIRHLETEQRRQAGGRPSPADISVAPGRLRRSNPMAGYARRS